MPRLDPCPAAISAGGVMLYGWGEIMASAFSPPQIWAVYFGALGILLHCWSRLYELWNYLNCTLRPVVPWWVSTALAPTPPQWVPSCIFYKTGTLGSSKMQFGKNPQAGVEKQRGFVLVVTSKHPKQWLSPALHGCLLFVKWANNIALLMKFLQETFKSSDIQKLFCYKQAKACPDKVTVSIPLTEQLEANCDRGWNTASKACLTI